MSNHFEEKIFSEIEDETDDLNLRPQTLSEFVGQKSVVDNLTVYLRAAKLRNEVIDHVLFSGPPGLGKTTLAKILSESQNGQFYQLSAPNVKRPGDIVKILSGLEKQDILFIDEIHRLSAPVEEILYPALEDREIDITLADGLGASAMTLDLPPFTMVGATTKPGNLSAPLRDRFGIHLRLEFYELNEIIQIVKRAADLWKVRLSDDALHEIASRSRRTPRISIRLLRRIWDYALVNKGTNANKQLENIEITKDIVLYSFKEMQIDKLGLTALDNEFLSVLAKHYSGGPVGLKPMSAILSEDLTTLEDFVEPYMIRLDLIQRTARGRKLTRKGFEHINLEMPNVENDLFT